MIIEVHISGTSRDVVFTAQQVVDEGCHVTNRNRTVTVHITADIVFGDVLVFSTNLCINVGTDRGYQCETPQYCS